MIFALWDRAKLAEDSRVEDSGGWGGVTLAVNFGSREEVDAVTEEARAAGATIGREPGRDVLGRLHLGVHRPGRPPVGGRPQSRTGPSPRTAASGWDESLAGGSGAGRDERRRPAGR